MRKQMISLYLPDMTCSEDVFVLDVLNLDWDDGDKGSPSDSLSLHLPWLFMRQLVTHMHV